MSGILTPPGVLVPVASIIYLASGKQAAIVPLIIPKKFLELHHGLINVN